MHYHKLGFFSAFLITSGDRYCGGRLERPSGSFKTPNWPDRDYPAGVACVWHIVAPKNQVRFPENMKKVRMCELPRWCEWLRIQGEEVLLDTVLLHAKTQIKMAFALFDLQSHEFSFRLQTYNYENSFEIQRVSKSHMRSFNPVEDVSLGL